MDPQHLHPNPTHTHDFSFYDHQRREEVSCDQHLRESDLLNTIISFPSTVPSHEPFLLHRHSLQERRIIPNTNFFMHSTNSTSVSLNIGASRDELQQLNSSRDMCESNAVRSGMQKIRDTRPLSSVNARYNAENILARFASNNPRLGGGDGGRGELWSYADRNDIPDGSISSLQLPMNISLGENLHSYPGAHSMVSTILSANSDKGGGASYAMSTHRRDGMWADDHGTELLLLPGVSGVDDNHHPRHPRNIAHVHDQAGKASLNCDNLKTVTNLKPLGEYLNMHSADQGRAQQNPSFHGFSTYPGTSAGTLRDLSLSLSAQESSQNALFSPSGFLAGAGTTCSHLQSSVYLKAAQHILSELCGKIIAEAAAGSLLKNNVVYGNVGGGGTGGVVSTIARSDLSFISAEGSRANVGATSSALHGLQQLRSSHDQQVPAAMAHMQLHDHSPHHLQHDHLQPSLMDRSQILDLKRRKLLIMLEELEKRFKRYQEQMQVLVMALETSGVGLMLEGVAPYKEAAGQAMQKRFTCLRDAIFASETFIMGGFSGDGGAGGHAFQQAMPGAGECDQAGTSAAARYRLLDQQLRHQWALQQVGLFPQPPWRPQRGLPERSVSLLRAWLFDHFLHPYPKDTEKVLLARQTGLTRNQVSNWFINARVRLWKPMVEEMYQEEIKTAEMRRTGGQGNPIKPTPTSHSTRSTTGTSDTHHFHVDQSKKHVQSDFDNHVMAMQDVGPLNAIQGIETSRFFYKPNEYYSDSQPRQFHHHQDDQVRFAASIEVPAGKAAMETVLEAAQQCGTHTWPFIQHQTVPYDAQEQQQHYCNSDISTALMRFGSSGGVTLTLGLQQHSGAGGSMNCAGAPPFERSPAGVDDVNAAAHRWCE